MEKIKNNDYSNLLQELRGIIEKGQYQAYKAVDNIKSKPIGRLVKELLGKN